MLTETILRQAWVFVGVGALFAGLGAAFLAFARHADAKNWILQRAPLLSVDRLNARDDAWVQGAIVCHAPLSVPHFTESCVAYAYNQEEKIEETIEDSGGRRRTRTRWVTRQTRVEAVDFEIIEGDRGSIRIHADEADLRDLPRLGPVTTHGGQLRHSARYLPYPSKVSAMGCVSEHADWLEKHANIPLIVTPRTREEVLASAERSENAFRISGHVTLLLGLIAVLYGLALRYGIPAPAKSLWSVGHGVLAVISGVTLFVASWTLYSFNTMLTYRLRTKAAWHQIDVDLKNRFDLIPRLVEVVRGAVGHEESTFTRLTALRSGASSDADDRASTIGQERETASVARQLVMIQEEYPELGTAPVFAKLHRELVALEDKIAHDRAFYDDCATEFNTYIAELPSAWLAGACGFQDAPLFRAHPSEVRPPSFNVVGPKRPG